MSVRDTSRDPKLHHFKCLELVVHEDTKSGSQVNPLFHFTFPKFQHHEDDGTASYAWDINANPRQRLYLSHDTTRMMEVINNVIGTVYVRVNIDETLRYIEGSEGAECHG